MAGEPDCRIKLNLVPADCPHLNARERLWGRTHRHITHNRCCASFKDFGLVMLTFRREDVPKDWNVYCDEVTDISGSSIQ
jgi:hypothetical protein